MDPKRTYLHATLALRARLGVRVYECAVRVKNGALKGAIVPICDGRIPPEIKDPYQAFYALPEDVSLPARDLDYEVVHYWAK